MNIDFKSIFSISLSSEKKSACIISIKDNNISICTLNDTSKGIVIEKYNEKSLSEYNNVQQRIEVIQKTLTYWAQIGYKNNKDKVYVLYPYEYANYQTFDFPKIPLNELKEAIKLKLNLNDKEIFDFTVTREFKVEDKTRIEVLILTYDEAKLNEVINLIENTGFLINAIVPEICALESLFSSDEIKEYKEGCLFIKVSQEDTNIIAFNNSAYSFSRRLNVGKKTLKNNLIGTTICDTGQICIDDAMAEKILDQLGIVLDDMDGEFDQIKYSNIKVLQRPVLERYLSELYRTFDFFSKVNYGNIIKRIYLIGQSNQIKNITTFLKNEFKVEVINLEENIKIINNTEAKDLSILLGIFLDKGQRINLLPTDLQYRPIIEKANNLIKLTTILIFTLFVFFTGYNQTKIFLLKNNIKKAESNLEALNPSLIVVNKLEEKNKEYQAKKLYFKELIGNNILNDTFFVEISNLIPNDVVLDNLSANQSIPGADGQTPTVNISVEGLIFQGTTPIADNLAKVILNFEKSPLFSDVKLQYAKINNDHNVEAQEFKIIARCNIYQEES